MPWIALALMKVAMLDRQTAENKRRTQECYAMYGGQEYRDRQNQSQQRAIDEARALAERMREQHERNLVIAELEDIDSPNFDPLRAFKMKKGML